MNKRGFLEELSKKTGLNEEKCIVINDIIEETSLVGNKNKEKMISGFVEKLSITEEEAEKIYETAIGIIGEQIKEKIKHPFKK